MPFLLVNNDFFLLDVRKDSLLEEEQNFSENQDNFSNYGYMPEQETDKNLDVECKTPVYLEPQ